MTKEFDQLAERYGNLLDGYVRGAGETALQSAYEIGRRAVQSGLGCLDIAQVHQDALLQCLLGALTPEESTQIARLGSEFFAESLSPYEMTHRGYKEAMLDLSRRAVELAVVNRRLEAEISERKRVEGTLREIPKRILEAQEAERRRIAHELHDDVCQRLSATKLHIGAFENEVTKNDKKMHAKLQLIKRQINMNIREVRRIAAHLRPSALDDMGLHVALRLLCEEFQKANRTRAVFSMKDRSPRRLESAVELTLYRIAQEGLSNIAKHAQAKTVSMRLARMNGLVRLEINDNGRGFEVEKIRSDSTRGYKLGLLSMKERAELLKGTCRIESTPGRGTKIRVEIPLDSLEEHGKNKDSFRG